VSGTSRRDALALFAVVAVLAGYAIARNAGRWLHAASRILPAVEPAYGLLAGGSVVLLAAVVLGARRRRHRRMLKARVGWLLLPADTFDPPDEGPARFASQLGRSRRRGRGWLERPASAVGVQLLHVGDGRMGYAVNAPEHADGLLRSALATYPEVDLADLLPSGPANGEPVSRGPGGGA
jgi:hypothetical protein